MPLTDTGWLAGRRNVAVPGTLAPLWPCKPAGSFFFRAPALGPLHSLSPLPGLLFPGLCTAGVFFSSQLDYYPLRTSLSAALPRALHHNLLCPFEALTTV